MDKLKIKKTKWNHFYLILFIFNIFFKINLMQIKELTIPPNEKKITYEICKNGWTNIYTSKKEISNALLQNWQSCKIQLGQFNSIQMTKESMLQNVLNKKGLENIGENQKISIKKVTVTCSCKKSKCLKMYCECFSKKLFCGLECMCKGCSNTQVNRKKLFMIREEIEVKKHVEDRGCKCQKSNCVKKYCECFSENKKCGKFCQCINCQNLENNLKKQEN